MFDDLNDEDLAAKVAELRDKYVALCGGDVVDTVVADGRRMEFTPADAERVRQLWLSAKRTLDARNGVFTSGSAIGVSVGT